MLAGVISRTILRGFSTDFKGTSHKQQGGPDISLLSPRLQSLWDHPRNAHLGNTVIKPYSNLTAHWSCTACPDGHPHRWEARVDNTTSNRGCPFCSGIHVCPHNSLARKAPHLISEWDPAKNPASPHDYTHRSGHRAHWICGQGHQWQAKIVNRVRHKHGCPVCAKARPRLRLPTLTASTSRVMQLWDQEQNTTAGRDPSTLTCGSKKKAHFTCSQCPELQSHRWTATIYAVVRGSGCPYCSSHKVCKCNSLETLRPDLAAEWCYAKNDRTPRDYTARSHEEVWWENAERGQWNASIDSRFYSSPKPEVWTHHMLSLLASKPHSLLVLMNFCQHTYLLRLHHIFTHAP